LNEVTQLLLFSAFWDEARHTLSDTVSPDMHRVNLDCLRHSSKGHFILNRNLFDREAKENYQALLVIWCLFSIVLLHILQIAELQHSISHTYCLCTPACTSMVKV